MEFLCGPAVKMVTSMAGGAGVGVVWVPSLVRGTKISHAMWYGRRKEKKRKKERKKEGKKERERREGRRKEDGQSISWDQLLAGCR